MGAAGRRVGGHVQSPPLLSQSFSLKTLLGQCGRNLCGTCKEHVSTGGSADLGASAATTTVSLAGRLPSPRLDVVLCVVRGSPAMALGTSCPSAGDQSLFVGGRRC